MTAALPPDAQVLHASCVVLKGRGLLVIGPSGSGKSALCLQLLALGAELVADDRTAVTAEDGGVLIARCASPDISGLVEAREVGILNAPRRAQAAIVLVADLGRTETDRLPPRRHITIAGVDLPLVLQSQKPHFPAALMLYLLHGRHA